MIHKSANKTFPVIATAGLCFSLINLSLSHELLRYSLQLFYLSSQQFSFLMVVTNLGVCGQTF